MVILFFTRLFYPHVGGVEKHVLELSKRLIEKGHTVCVVTEVPEGIPVKAHEVFEKITIYRIPVGKSERAKKYTIWRWLFDHRDLVKDADIVHCHDVFFWYLPFRFIYPRKKVFTTFHGYESYPISKKAIVVRKISEKLSLGNICIGSFIQKWYGTHPTIISYGATDIPSSQKSWQKKESAVFIGRLDEQTNILTYLEAIKLIKERNKTFDFLVIGDGKFKNDAQENGKVIQSSDATSYLQQYHFAFVSRYLSILEAFANKRLVFAVFDNPLKKDYLLLTPFKKYIVAVDSAKDLIEQVSYFLAHPKEEKELVEEAFAWVQKQSWESLALQYLSFWSQR